MFRKSKKNYGPRMSQDEVCYVEASDGWRLALHHYRPKGDSPHGEPVLLLHGLGASAEQFDLGVGDIDAPVPSLAHWLAEQGYDVWVPDLRGSGKSERPSPNVKKRWDWCVDDFIEKDMPAFVDYILERSSYKKLHWIGHSMGGILLFCYCARYGSDKIASGVAAGAGLDYSEASSSYRAIEPLKEIGRHLKRIPVRYWSRQFAPLFGRVWNPIEASFFHPANIAPAAARSIPAGVQYDLSGEVLYQLASLFKEGGFLSADGRIHYAEIASRVELPILLLAGERDLQCRPKVVAKARRLLGGKHNRMLTYGKNHGQEEDYGHFDLFSGLRVEREVFPDVETWLQEHPALPRIVESRLSRTA